MKSFTCLYFISAYFLAISYYFKGTWVICKHWEGFENLIRNVQKGTLHGGCYGNLKRFIRNSAYWNSDHLKKLSVLIQILSFLWKNMCIPWKQKKQLHTLQCKRRRMLLCAQGNIMQEPEHFAHSFKACTWSTYSMMLLFSHLLSNCRVFFSKKLGSDQPTATKFVNVKWEFLLFSTKIFFICFLSFGCTILSHTYLFNIQHNF